MAPAYAASFCPTKEQQAIDQAFAAVSRSLVAYWTENTAISDGTTQIAYFNINNNTPYAINTTGGGLLVNFYTYFRGTNGPITNPNAIYPTSTTISSSYGGISDNVPFDYRDRSGVLHHAIKTSWAAGVGSQIRPSTSGSDSTADFDLHTQGSMLGYSDDNGTHVKGTVMCAELKSLPKLSPSYESIVELARQQDRSLFTDTDACQRYYDTKASVTPAITVSGPLLTGATAWNFDGGKYALDGGNQLWRLGSTVCSDQIGNYISSSFPPSSGRFDWAATNGIF